VLFFGQVAEAVNARELHIEADDTEALLTALHEQFPVLKNAVFAVAVNKSTVHTNTALSNNDEVALLPPFSGG
jgi:molybdopterin converting factor small subunit